VRTSTALRAIAVASALSAVAASAAVAPPAKIELPRRGFEFITRERGVWVYKNASADLIWIGAVGIIPAPAEKVFEALLDYDRQAGNIGRVSEAKVLSRDADGLYVYERLNLPIISDRDFTLRVDRGVDGKRRWITYSAVQDHGPAPRDGIVRVSRHTGVWELIPTDDGKGTYARSEFRIDLGGSVPLWMAKSKAGVEIPELYANICKLSLGQANAGACP
jgi:hypothetical protein